jgi:hypothetical protein
MDGGLMGVVGVDRMRDLGWWRGMSPHAAGYRSSGTNFRKL